MLLFLGCCCHIFSLLLTKCTNFTLAEQSMGWLRKMLCDIFSFFRYIVSFQEAEKYRAAVKEIKTKRKRRREVEEN